jgi:hypothetical protein
MKSWLTGALALLALSQAAAASAGDAPFGCDARNGQICFFKLYLGPRATRIVQLPAGMKVKVPGVNIGSDSYCVRLAQSPASGCQRKVINATYNN